MKELYHSPFKEALVSGTDFSSPPPGPPEPPPGQPEPPPGPPEPPPGPPPAGAGGDLVVVLVVLEVVLVS